MRVLLVHDYGTLNGGAEVMIVALRDALRRRGHETILFTSTARPLPLPLVSDEHCYGTVSTLRRVLQAANPHAAARLRAVLRQFRPDVVHVKMFLTQLSPLILPPLRPFPALLHVVNYNLVCPINTKTLPDGTPCRHRAGIACRAAGCLSWPGVARTLVQRRLTTLDVFDRVIANSDWVARRLRAEGIAVEHFPGVPFADLREALADAIADEGLSAPVVSRFGAMLERTAPDLGHDPALYGDAEVLSFCSAGVAARLVAEAREHIALCPLSIAVYSLPHTPRDATLAWRPPTLDSPGGDAVRALMARIVTGAARLVGRR